MKNSHTKEANWNDAALVSFCNCAINDHRSKRVVNDQYATPHSRPWMVMLTRDGKYICGAALVNRPPNHHQADSTGSSDILLTAAHCLVQHGE
uniref:Peptidase S1 domain-containing protein n=1 Tax=Romanomermis culicivorax TaxID=13658 RepID=A0A915KD05_ROMCU